MDRGVLITGGSGSFGHAFVERLLREGFKNRIVIYSRSEHRQFQMAQTFKDKDPNGVLRFMIGDVRDRDRLRRAMNGIDTVIHAAALKRIEVGHYNPQELVKTNIMGSLNVVEAAQDAEVRKVIGLSTDKAYSPVSPYGASKAMMESLFLAANNTSGWNGPRFAICRYGNIWRSTGSVVPIWEQMIKDGAKELPITDPDVTRFFMRQEEAVQLVLDTIETMRGGEIRIPKLPAYRLGDLAEVFGLPLKVTGLPAFEKKHESMEDGNSSDLARRMTIKELREALSQ